MDNKAIYESLFQSDETFRRNFPNQGDFEIYVSQDGKLDELKYLYNYQEPDIEDPVKKKEGRSPFRSLFRYFGGERQTRVEVGEIADPQESSLSTLNSFNEKSEKFNSLRSELALYDLPFNTLSSPVSMAADLDPAGDYTKNPDLLSARNELFEIQEQANDAADFLISSKYGSPFSVKKEESTTLKEIDGDKKIPVFEVIDKEITEQGLQLAKELSTEKPDLTFKDLGYGEEYMMVVDEEKVRKRAGEIFHETFPEESVNNMESDYRFQKIKERLSYTANEVISVNNINSEISRSLREYFPDNLEIQKNGYKAIKDIPVRLSNDLWRTTKEIEMEANENIGSVLYEYEKIERETSSDIDAKILEFKNNYSYDDVTNQYLILPEQKNQFDVDLLSLTRYVESAQESLSQLKNQSSSKMNDMISGYQRKIEDSRKEIVKKYSTDAGSVDFKNYDPEKIKMAIEDAINNYNSKNTAMEVAAYMKNPAYNIAQGIVQGTGSLMRGMSKISDIYFSQFGSSGLGISTALKAFGEDLLKYDNKFFNPTYEMAGSDPWLLSKKAIYDFSRMGPTLIPTIVSAASGAPVFLTTSIGFLGDTAMEVDEVMKEVYDQTGDSLLAEKAAEDKLNEQFKILATYYADAALLTPSKFLRINNLGKAFAVNSSRLLLNYGEELFQEGMQNSTTKSIIDRYIKNKESDYSVLEEMMDPELMKSVAGMTLISQGITSTYDTYKQLRDEKIVTRVNELFNNKGIANLLNKANKVNKNAISGYYDMQYMMGNITQDQLADVKKAIAREVQFSNSSNIIAPNASEEKQAAIIGLLQEKDELETKIKGIENSTAKKSLDAKIKEIDKQIESIAESEGLEGFTTIKNKATGQVIVSVKNDNLKSIFANNPNASVIVSGLMRDVLEITTDDKTVNDLIEYSKAMESDKVQFGKEIQALAEKQRKERVERQEQIKNGETPVLTDEEFENKIKNEFVDLIKARDQRVNEIAKNGSNVQADIDRYKKQNEDSTISGVTFDPIFNVDENTNFEDIKLTFNNPKISTIIDQVKESLPAFKQLYANATVTFVKSNAEMDALGYKSANGLFDPDTNTIFINLESANEYTFFHELTHAALIKAFGEDTAVLFSGFVKDIERVLGPETSKRLKAFVSNYSVDMKPEEYLSQLGAFMGIEQNKLNVGQITKIKSLIYNILDTIGLKKLASYFNTGYNNKQLFDMFNALGKAYKTKDMSSYLKLANDVFVARSEKNAYVRNNNAKVNKGSVEFSEGVLSELSKEFGISQEESDDLGIKYDKEKNAIIANSAGVISTDQYFSVIADVLLHNYIKNNINAFLDMADNIDRSMYKKLRGLYEKNKDINDISKRAARSFYTYLANGSRIKNMDVLWDAVSNYFVGTSVDRLAGLYTLGSRYFNKRTDSNLGINQLPKKKLEELLKIAKNTSIYNVIDLHKNGYDFFTISKRVRKSINRSRILDIAIENFRSGNKFVEYSINEDYNIDRPSINILENQINIPEEMTEEDNLRLMYNILLLDLQRNNTSVFMTLLKKMSKIAGYESRLQDYKSKYLEEIENTEEPDLETARYLFDSMVDAFILKTNELLDNISNEELYRIENEVFEQYLQPYEIPLIEKGEEIDFMIYKILDPNSPFFSELRYKNIFDYHTDNYAALKELNELINEGKASFEIKLEDRTNPYSMDLDETQMIEEDIVMALEIKDEDILKLQDKFRDLIEFTDQSGESFFVKMKSVVEDAIENTGKYKFNVPLESLERLANEPLRYTVDNLVYDYTELLYDRNLFEAIFDKDPVKMEQYDDMFADFKDVEFKLYNQKRVKVFFEKHVSINEDEATLQFPDFEDNVYSVDNFIQELEIDYSNYINKIRNLESFDVVQSDIIRDLKEQVIQQLSPEPDLNGNIVVLKKDNVDGLVVSVKNPTGATIDNVEIGFDYDESNQNLNIIFKSERFGLEDTPLNEKRMFFPAKVAQVALSTMSMTPVRSISFTAASTENKKYESDPDAFRTRLYEAIGKRISGDFYYGRSLKASGDQKAPFVIAIPPIVNIGRYEMEFEPTMEQVSPANRVRESRNRAHKNISDFIESEKQKGTPASEIYSKAYVLFGDENLRTSKYGSEYQTERDEFQMKSAIDAMSKFSSEFEKRRQGIINFIDKYRDRASLLKLVNILRNGADFLDEETGLMAIEAPIETMDIVDPSLAQPISAPGTIKVKFSDYEIFLALSAIGETSNDLGKIFGNDFRQTIETAIERGQFSTNILSELSKDAQSKRITRRIEDLSMLGEIFNDIDPKSVIDYIVSNLDTLGIEPAFQNLLGRIQEAQTFQEMNGQIALSISDIRQQEGDLQSVSQLASFAGRILRLMRQISDNPSEIILDNIRKTGRTIPTSIENQIKQKSNTKLERSRDHKKALLNAWADPSDENINALLQAEKNLDDASWDLARTLNTEAVQGRYWSDVLQKHGAFALLSLNTVFLSAASVLELLYRQQFAPLSNFASYLADKRFDPIGDINGYKIRSRNSPFSKSFWKNSALAHKYTFDKNLYQMARGVLTGQTGTSDNLYYDLPAQANALRDASNFFSAMLLYGKKLLNKESLTDEDLAAVLERSLVEVDGKKILLGGKGYQLMAAAFRGLNPGYVQSELTARLMPLGLDQLGVNVLMMDSFIDYTSFQMAADYKGIPKGVIGSLMERSPDVSLRNAALLTQSLVTSGYIKSDVIELEALKSTFFNVNKLTKNMSGWRSTLRKKMNQKDAIIVEEIKKGDQKDRVKILSNYASLHFTQLGNLFTYAAVPFLRVPSNIAFMLINRANPLGATVNSVRNFNKYKKAVDGAKAKYNVDMGRDITLYQEPSKAVDLPDPFLISEKNLKKKADIEKEMMDLYGAKRKYTESVGDIIFSSTLMGAAYQIVLSGAVTPSDDPEKRAALQEAGLESSELNISMLNDYIEAGGPSMTDDQRDKWIASRKIKSNDTKINLINLGTYMGYTLGFAADVYSQYRSTTTDKNNMMWDSLKKHYTTGEVLSTMSRTVFKMTPSAQFLEEMLQMFGSKQDKNMTFSDKMDNLLANLAATSGASFAPSIFGKPLSVSEGIKAQSTRDVDLQKEISNYPLDLKFLMMAHMRMSRNGIILPGMWRSEFYKAKIGLFGEDLTIRKTLSEPGTTASYIESTLNFFKLRRDARVMPKNIKDERRLNYEIEKHYDINEVSTGILSMAQAYARLGGDPAPFYNMFNSNLKNKFIVTEYGKNEEGVDMDVPITLPNDIFRAEARMLGEYKYALVGQIKDMINSTMSLSPDGKDNYTQEEVDYFKLNLKKSIDEINRLLSEAESDYQKDFMANRSNAVVRELYNRGLLSESDLNLFKEKGFDENSIKDKNAIRWGLDLYEKGFIEFSDPEYYAPDIAED